MDVHVYIRATYIHIYIPTYSWYIASSFWRPRRYELMERPLMLMLPELRSRSDLLFKHAFPSLSAGYHLTIYSLDRFRLMKCG